MASAAVLPVQSFSGADREIIGEIYRTLVLLGAESDLLGVVGSWKDSLSSEDVLHGVRAWNEATVQEIKGRIEHYEIASHPSVYIPAVGR